MKTNDIFVSAIQPDGKFCAFFEFEEDTSYFYLGTVENGEMGKILDAIHIESKIPDFLESDVQIEWAEQGHIA